MAKVIAPLQSSEARGRVGGLVYNTWRGIRTVKAHSDPTHQSDPKRAAQFAIVVAAGKRWRDLLTSQRSAWDEYANTHPDLDWTGSPKRIAGYHHFVRCNVLTWSAFAAWVDNPPTATCPYSLLHFYASADPPDTELHFSLSSFPPPAGYAIQIWRTKPLSAGINPTFHEAYWLATEDARVPNYYDMSPSDGAYTYWARVIRNNGTASAFIRTSWTV